MRTYLTIASSGLREGRMPQKNQSTTLIPSISMRLDDHIWALRKGLTSFNFHSYLDGRAHACPLVLVRLAAAVGLLLGIDNHTAARSAFLRNERRHNALPQLPKPLALL